ncbi:hypothetical protein AM571_CH02438 [Rhizobium etli 8C-3]|uniref:Uncharacterized protein n=1 Tax=Rhizobium etli 8C-3 TaxID=538025 RepID=A0A1L5P527_RHIET|nr:hypothetical protein [Rhizobium etli]APO75247.1 hypothetical protein AM571_CH02438 [Rhizobium etli 8C-3]
MVIIVLISTSILEYHGLLSQTILQLREIFFYVGSRNCCGVRKDQTLAFETKSFTFTSGISCVACAEVSFLFVLQLLMLILLDQPDRDPSQHTGDHHPAHSVADATNASGVGIALSHNTVAGSLDRMKSGGPDAY